MTKIAIVIPYFNDKITHGRSLCQLAYELSLDHNVTVVSVEFDPRITENRLKWIKVPSIRKPFIPFLLSFLISSKWILSRNKFEEVHCLSPGEILQEYTLTRAKKIKA